MVHRDGTVDSGSIKEITEPLVIHKTQRRHPFLHCQAGSVAGWHARQFHPLISSLCKTEGVKPPIRLAGFLGSQEKAGGAPGD